MVLNSMDELLFWSKTGQMPIDRDFTGWHRPPGEGIPLSLYPDYTVGPGITPGLLDLAWQMPWRALAG
jgi:hypothetical protein